MREKLKSVLDVAPDDELAEFRRMKTRSFPLESSQRRGNACDLVTCYKLSR